MLHIILGISFFGMITFMTIAIQNGIVPNKHITANITTITTLNETICASQSIISYQPTGYEYAINYTIAEFINSEVPCPINQSDIVESIDICYCMWNPALYGGYPCNGNSVTVIVFLILTVLAPITMCMTWIYHHHPCLNSSSIQQHNIHFVSDSQRQSKKNDIEMYTIESHGYPHIAKSKSSSILIVNP